jgi:type IV secretory pathway protease TraF
MERKRVSDKIVVASGIWVLVLALALKAFYSYMGYFGGLNTSYCIKGRYFFVDKHFKKLSDGDYFVIRFKGSRLYPKGTLFVKIVGCTPGQRLYTTTTKNGTAYYCNNRFLGYACSKKEFKSCPAHANYNMIIPKGYYYAMGTAWDAYDSRYWGLASIKEVVGKAKKVF